MGRCNGGGGRRHGGGGFQEGQNKGTKSGKSGHGKSGAHDATQSQRQERRYDKYGQPLNYGPFRNGYYVADQNKNKDEAQSVGIAAEQVAALSLVAAATPKEAAPAPAQPPPPPPPIIEPTRKKHAQRAAATTVPGEMSASQKKESERLSAAAVSLDAEPSHAAMRETRRNLPAHNSKTELLSTLSSAQSLVICGETGCGKSTQVPQFLLESAVANGTGALCTILIA